MLSTVSASNWRLPRAFAICLCRDWTLCCCNWLTFKSLKGVQDAVRHSALRGNWWDRSSSSVQFRRSVVLILCNPMDCSTAGFPVHHQFLEFTQTRFHWVGDATQPSYPLSSPSPPAFNLSHDQGLFQWVRSLHQVAKVLEFQFEDQSFQWIFRTAFL